MKNKIKKSKKINLMLDGETFALLNKVVKITGYDRDTIITVILAIELLKQKE